MSTRALVCRSCGASLDAERLDRRLSVITCAHCGTLHELPRPTPAPAAGDGPGTRPAGPPERPAAALPERFEVGRPDGGLLVTWPKGRKSGAIALAAFAAIWGGVTVAGGAWFLAPLSLVFLYVAAVRAFNRTSLSVDAESIRVRQGPIPAGGAKRVARADVEQLWVSEHVSRVREGGDRNARVRERRSYRVTASLRGERSVRLVGGLGAPGQALWLEQEIERTLGLRDRAVAGEYGR